MTAFNIPSLGNITQPCQNNWKIFSKKMGISKTLRTIKIKLKVVNKTSLELVNKTSIAIIKSLNPVKQPINILIKLSISKTFRTVKSNFKTINNSTM